MGFPLARTGRIALALAALIFVVAATQREEPAGRIAQLRQAYAGPVESWPAAQVDEGAVFSEFGPLPPRVALEGNAALRAQLGARLFEERHLSGSGQLACASCHNVELGFSDGIKTSIGHDRQRGQRNALSLYAASQMDSLFWDGRSPSLEAQAIEPIINPIEMAADPAQIEAWINTREDYRQEFAAAYGTPRIAIGDIALALADFERTLRPRSSKWDRVFRDGTEVLADDELLGLHLFRTRARCANCHSGTYLTDGRFHNLGISFYGRTLEDVGRYAVTGDPADVGYFRTPSLRGVSRSDPYMHNGIFPHLRGVVATYAGGGGRDRTVQSETTDAPPPLPDPLLKDLDLTAGERAALVAFLNTL
ncbi:cytochrome-c peroxidase [Altererythrobacter aestuarii]|uniref:Cytochrome-c peroxidase n=1 Tax=Alteraurantiacibacter aestuarii TaxID=650004 RepID=A0A844ZLQ0_9SPHN|nr:cytochrome-c peroxidase [Alteraurantiacibacter aestuarii]